MELKNSLNSEFVGIHQLCNVILQEATMPSLLKVTDCSRPIEYAIMIISRPNRPAKFDDKTWHLYNTVGDAAALYSGEEFVSGWDKS